MQKHGLAISMKCVAILFWITAPTEVSNGFGSFRLPVRLSVCLYLQHKISELADQFLLIFCMKLES